MKLAGALTLKNVLIFSALSGVFFATPFIFRRNEDHIFNLSKVRGLTTRVGIFLNGFPNNEIKPTSIFGGVIPNGQSYEIQKVSQQTISPKQEKKADLIAEFYLDNLHNSWLWKVCLPENSFLKANENNRLSSESPKTNNQKLCKTENLYSLRKNPNFEVIKELLRRSAHFLEVENAYNVLLPNEDNVYFWEMMNKNKKPTEELKKIKKDCQLSKEEWKDSFRELFQSKVKNCFLSPTSMRVNFDLTGIDKLTSTASVATKLENKKLTIEDISKSTLSGRLDYSLFDYSNGKRKSIKIQNGDSKDKFPIFQFRTKNKYSLNKEEAKQCKLDFEKIHGLVTSRELKFNELVVGSECYE